MMKPLQPSRDKIEHILNSLTIEVGENGDMWIEHRQEAIAAIQTLIKEARIDELKLLQMSEEIPDDVKDICYFPHIKDRIKQLSSEGGKDV